MTTSPNIVVVHEPGQTARAGARSSGACKPTATTSRPPSSGDLACRRRREGPSRAHPSERPDRSRSHSYGGQVITSLGTDAPNLVGLVYIAGFGLDEVESIGALLKQLSPTRRWASSHRQSSLCPLSACSVLPSAARRLVDIDKLSSHSVTGSREPTWRIAQSSA
jgi:hypothetical protein